MTIETKYNIGDEVWVKVQGNPTALKVENDDMNVALDEKYLFPTKEELLKSL